MLPRHLGAALAVSLGLHSALLSGVGARGSELQPSGETRPVLRVRMAANVEPKHEAADLRATAPVTFPVPLPPRYFRSSELDESPAPVELAPLVYPEREYMNRIGGAVRLRIFISPAGAVERAEVVSASPAGRFEQAAIDAVQATRFRPGMKDGQPVPAQKLIEVEFDPYGPRP